MIPSFLGMFVIAIGIALIYLAFHLWRAKLPIMPTLTES